MTKKQLALLQTVASAMTNAAAPYLMATQAEMKPLTDLGLVESNPDLTDGDKIAFRTNDAGNAALGNPVTAEDDAPTTGQTSAEAGAGDPNAANTLTAIQNGQPVPVVGGFTIYSDIDLPPSRRGGGKDGTVYPFDQLQPGQGFFVPSTADRPNPAKSLASTVSSASKRYKDKDGRAFTVRNVANGEKYGHAGVRGALIARNVQNAPVAAPAPSAGSQSSANASAPVVAGGAVVSPAAVAGAPGVSAPAATEGAPLV